MEGSIMRLDFVLGGQWIAVSIRVTAMSILDLVLGGDSTISRARSNEQSYENLYCVREREREKKMV